MTGPAARHRSTHGASAAAGATGGVGNRAVQLAAQAGSTVIATARTEGEQALVRELGAAEVVDYSGDVADAVRAGHPDGVDAVLNFAGDPAALLPLVRSGGRFSSTLLMSAEQLPAEEVTVTAVYAIPDPATLESPADRTRSPTASCTCTNC
jgi:NADPH:quinone reductase-like Zn-dependent oxidoreductase